MPLCAVADGTLIDRDDISFRRISKDKKQRIAWIKACKSPFSVDSARVCSSHFSKEDFKKDFKHEFGISSRRRWRTAGAVPRFNIHRI